MLKSEQPGESGLRTVPMIRYAVPLREGGSLPAIAEGADGFDYVLKFRGAGQGTKALIAELIGGELARAAGMKVPELVFATVDEAFGRTEPDEEIQDLLRASTGTNLALHYLSGSYTFDPVVTDVNAELASRIVWFDAFLMNVDRTRRNTNMLVWHKELWLIDHGAALYFHHNDDDYSAYIERPFVQIKDHVLLRNAGQLAQADNEMKAFITRGVIESVVGQIPDSWLEQHGTSFGEQRQAYTDFLWNRLQKSSIFVKTAEDARNVLV